MTDPNLYLTMAGASLAGLGMICTAGLAGWRGWLSLKEREITAFGEHGHADGPNLPNASARVKFGGGLQARFAYAKALSRPDFGSLNPGLNYARSTNPNVQNGGSSGNPDLKPEKADSYDATLEYYFGRSNYVSVGVYKKDITNRIATGITPMTIDGITYQITQPRNLGSAKLEGVEASAQLFFGFLPGALSGLGASGNFTYNDSKVTTKGDVLEGSQLLGVSKYNFNAGLLFEKYGFSGRAVYTWRSKYYDNDATGNTSLRSVDPDRVDDPSYNPTQLNYVRPSGRLDVGLSYDVNEKLRIDLGATNVLHSRYYGYFNDPFLPNEYRYDESTYSFGVRYRL